MFLRVIDRKERKHELLLNFLKNRILMKIGETKETCDQILKEHIPLLKMIDQKIDNDMDKVLNKMDALKAEIKGEMNTMHKLLWTIIFTLLGILLAGIVSFFIASYFR